MKLENRAHVCLILKPSYKVPYFCIMSLLASLFLLVSMKWRPSVGMRTKSKNLVKFERPVTNEDYPPFCKYVKTAKL